LQTINTPSRRRHPAFDARYRPDWLIWENEILGQVRAASEMAHLLEPTAPSLALFEAPFAGAPTEMTIAGRFGACVVVKWQEMIDRCRSAPLLIGAGKMAP
jgi:hypothetical protein